MKQLLRVVATQQPFFLIVLLISIAGHVVFTIVDPVLIKYLFDEGLLERNHTGCVVVSIVFVFFGAGIWLVFFLQTILMQKLKNRITQHLTLKMVAYYYTRPYQHIVDHDSGYMLSRVYDEPATIASEAVDMVIQMHVYSLICIAALLVSLYLSWELTLFLLFIVPMLYYISTTFRSRIKQNHKRSKNKKLRSGT